MAKEKGKELPVDLKICKSVKVAKNTHSPRKSKLYFPEFNILYWVGGGGRENNKAKFLIRKWKHFPILYLHIPRL